VGGHHLSIRLGGQGFEGALEVGLGLGSGLNMGESLGNKFSCGFASVGGSKQSSHGQFENGLHFIFYNCIILIIFNE